MATCWGICCVGKISHDFSAALRTLVPEDHKVSGDVYFFINHAQKLNMFLGF